MKKKIIKGIFLGFLAGTIDVILMFLQKLPWTADLSAFIHWIIIGFVLSIIQLPLKGIWKGLFISILLTSPIMIIVIEKEPISLIPILSMTAILGSCLGWLIDFKKNNIKK
jgi:hypothetical protein